MKAFSSYVASLERLYFNAAVSGATPHLMEEVDAALDGQAGRELRRLIPLDDLRATGTFFTNSGLAARVAERVLPTLGKGSKILDPACGAGDLLLACAKGLAAGRGFRDTLDRWGRVLLGRDLQPEFVAAARVRLALAALKRGMKPRGGGEIAHLDALAEIKEGCGRTDCKAIGRATHIVINPPFNLIPAPPACEWTSGGVSAAAVFLDECLQSVAPGARVVAILPDVLRSGERYSRWRRRITQRARLESVDLFGQFDRWADIDVFLLELLVTSEPVTSAANWEYPTAAKGQTLGDRFEVSVGPLVPFRHAARGPWCRYIHARGIPAWGVVEAVVESRRFKGRTHSPPFTVVRRTSRVGDKHRAVATVICGSSPVAVENHLLVLKPKDGRTETCRNLLLVLQRPEIDAWLNQRIRCRHLTVNAIREIPLPETSR
jgi:N-6 DNA Methylase